MKGSPLRDRLLSNSPDPIKSSILRDSGMGWNSPPSSEPTSPLRIAKRDPSPSKPTQADLARRSSSSYRAMRNNNLVSKSPFKSQIPTPSTPSRNPPLPVLFPTRKVSGEKRPRPPSMHEQAEEENERPFALKRDRKQSKTFQGLIEKEPVTKSPFRRLPSKAEDKPPRLPPKPPLPAQSSRIPTATTSSTSSPLRSSLVSKRMHGPRLSGGKRRERRKTVTFDERMDVMEFERDEYNEEAVEDSEDDYGPGYDDDDDADDPFYQNHLRQEPSHDVDPEPEPGYPNPDDSYESIELSDSGVAEPELQLDVDTSINGLVDDLFAGHNNPTSTPPRAGPNELPVDLETEDGVPLGRTHHRDRALRFHHQQHSDSPARNSPISFSLNRPITLPNTSDDSAPSTPPKHGQSSSPPLGRSTHMERRMAARQEEQEVDKDVDMLPASPSPVKPRTPGQHQYLMQDDPDDDSLVPKFDLSAVGGTPNRSHTSEAVGPDPFALPNLKDEALLEGGNSFISMSGTDTSLDADATQNSELMNMSALEKKFGGSNERLLNTSMEASLMQNEHASFSQPPAALPSDSRPFSPTEQASAAPPVRRSPLPPIPAGIAPHPGSPRGISPLRGRSSSPRLRPRVSRDDVRLRMMGPAIRSRRFGSASPSPRSSPAPEAQVNGRDSLRVNEEAQKDEDSQDDQVQFVVSAALSDEAEYKEQVTEEAEPGNRLSADLGHGVTPDAASIMTGMTENSAEEATIETALVVGVAQHHHHPQQTDFVDEEEKMDTTPLEPEEEEGHSSYEDAPEEDEGERQEEFGILKPPMIGTLGLSSSKLNFDFGSKFGLGGLGIDTSMDDSPPARPPQPSYHRERDVPESIASRASGDSRHSKTSSTSSNMVRMGAAEEDVSMDMRSALDRLMEDVGAGVTPMDTSVATDATDDDEPLDLRAARVKSQATTQVRVMERAATDSAVIINSGSGALSRSGGSDSSIAPPPLPKKDNIRAREQLILEKRREMRRMEEAEDDEYHNGGDIYVAARRGPAAGIGKGRPSRRRSMSTGDMHDLAQKGAKLDVAPMLEEDPLEESIEKELQKRDGPKKSQKYFVREREAIYASSDVSHMAGPGDVNAGKAWRTVRRPSDMNEYSKQIKEYRANQNPGKAYGKVFVKVMGVKNLHVPIPQEPTAMSCTLNNGIHFVTTPECRLSKDSVIGQEFELIEHSKLEFTLTLKVRRDPHIIAQFKALQPPPPPLPPPMVQQISSKSSTKSGGMFSLFSSSPKKSKDKEKEKAFVVAPPPPPPIHRLPENLARYMKPDGTFARAFISFKDIAHRCDTKIFETTFPLIGQRLEVGNKASTMQVGEMVLQMFRLPPLPGILPDQLPQSLEECHRGLRHVNWHKVTYFEGTLTQSGGDCTSWRRRRLRVVGANLVAFNDVTKRVTATINLKSAIAVEDDQEARSSTLSPASGTTARSVRHDHYEGLYGVERSFRLIFPGDEEICFFADTDEDKARWLEVLRALVGHIPPHPLWAELLWQRQNDLNSRNVASTSAQ